MSRLKKATVVMLSTEKASNIISKLEKRHENDLEIGFLFYDNKTKLIKNTTWQPKHLYFLSKKDAKVDRITIHPTEGVVIITHVFDTGFNVTKPEWYRIDNKKGELWLSIKDYKGICVSSTDEELNLPRPSTSFIRAYCKKGGIEEVLLEYVRDGIGLTHDQHGIELPWKLKVAPDNTITTKPIRDNYSKKEVEDFLHKKMREEFGLNYDNTSTLKFIEDNL